jgi:aldose 1-epimerase
MTFQVRVERRTNAFGLDDRVWVLDDGQGSFVEVAPPLGFNAYRWHVPAGEILYADPMFFQEHKPTRSGFPILFPFPNRIRDGRFTWNGKNYQLPTNDPSGKNAIHGFATKKPWRVIAEGADTESGWVTAQFTGSKDAPETLDLWPTDYQLAVTYRLQVHSLEVLAEVSNPGQKVLPWGLGYHPYFALSLFGGPDAQVGIRANRYWELGENLPTGRRLPVDGSHDLRAGQAYRDLHLDDVFTDLAHETSDLAIVGWVSHKNRRLEMHASGIFREIVGFTPPHREAVCLEPYTCATDAINLEQKGVDAGWRVLQPGQAERGRIKLLYQEASH